MKNNIYKIFYLLLFVILSCKPPTAPEDNPNDPTSFKPEVTITEGATEGSIINSRVQKFSWKGNVTSTGLAIAVEFSYRVRTDDPTTNLWSNWSPDTTVTFTSLDDDKFIFEIKGRTATSTESQIVSRTFTVDKLPAFSFAVFPELSVVTKDSTFKLYFHAKEVRALMALHTVLKYDPAKLSIFSVDTVSYFARKNNTAYFAIVDSINTGRVLVDLGIAMGKPKGVSGTGRLLILKCKLLTLENATVEIIAGETSARDTLNKNISFTNSNFSSATIKLK